MGALGQVSGQTARNIIVELAQTPLLSGPLQVFVHSLAAPVQRSLRGEVGSLLHELPPEGDATGPRAHIRANPTLCRSSPEIPNATRGRSNSAIETPYECSGGRAHRM